MATIASIFGLKNYGPQTEVLDLRHVSGAQLRPLLEDESAQWAARLQWDYSKSVELLLEYLDGRVLPGFVATKNGRITGYAFSVLEAAKAVIGDVYAFNETGSLTNPVCETVLAHLIEMLQNTPGVERIEAQLLMFPVGAMAKVYAANGFRSFPRLFMMGNAARAAATTDITPPSTLTLESWRPEFYDSAAELIHRCYIGHRDSDINDQYRSVSGSLRFLHNIIRFPGCGTFDAPNSWVMRDRRTGIPQALLLSSRVRPDVAHVTQLCVTPGLRGLGLGRMLLQQAARELTRTHGSALSLTVTERNLEALRLYEELGFKLVHRFEAMVWDSSS